MKPLYCVTCLVIAFSFTQCSSKTGIEQNNSLSIRLTKFSESVKDSFYIDIQLPERYYEHPEKKYPVLVFVDGNFYFPIMSSIASEYPKAGLLKPSIVVGVGYKTFQLMDSLRQRDYLYPKPLPSDELISGGGGLNFYNFLTKELLPQIDQSYRTEKSNRTLLGHSFGGYFVLYSLSNQLSNSTNDFKNFIAASPSLWYNNFYLNRLPRQLQANKQPLGLFISVGSKEDSVWMVNPLGEITHEIEKRKIDSLNFKSFVYNHLEHMDVAVLSFTKGLQELSATK